LLAADLHALSAAGLDCEEAFAVETARTTHAIAKAGGKRAGGIVVSNGPPKA